MVLKGKEYGRVGCWPVGKKREGGPLPVSGGTPVGLKRQYGKNVSQKKTNTRSERDEEGIRKKSLDTHSNGKNQREIMQRKTVGHWTSKR